MNDLFKGFVKGAKETPVGFFAPAIALWRGLVSVTESLLNQKKDEESGAKHA